MTRFRVIDLETGAISVVTDLNGEVFARAAAGTTEHITTVSLGESIDAWVTVHRT